MSQFPLAYNPSHSHLTSAVYWAMMSHFLQREKECRFNLATPVVILTLHHWSGWARLCLIIFFLNFLTFLIRFFDDQCFLRIFFIQVSRFLLASCFSCLGIQLNLELSPTEFSLCLATNFKYCKCFLHILPEPWTHESSLFDLWIPL